MSHLTLSQRYEISTYHQQKLSMSTIAEKIGTNKSTVSRELKRNSDELNGQYKADLAKKKADIRHQDKNNTI